MKAVIEFNLPQEHIEHVRAVRAGDAWNALHELDNHLRSVIKYGHGNYKSTEELATYLRSVINDALSLVEE